MSWRIGRPKERKSQGNNQLVGAVRTHTALSIKFTILCGCGSLHHKTITIVLSKVTDHHNKYNRNEKVLNFVRIIKMWHRDEVSKSWKNGAGRLAWHRVATDPQFVKKVTSAKYSKAERSAVKWGMLVSVKKPQRGTGHFYSSLPAPPRMPLFFTRSRSLLFPPFWCDPLSLLQPLGLPFFLCSPLCSCRRWLVEMVVTSPLCLLSGWIGSGALCSESEV